MKINQTNYRFALLLLCTVFALNSCSKSSENSNTAKTEVSQPKSPQQATSLPVNTSTPVPTATSTPKPVERKDVRITGLMIGTGLDKNNEIKNPTSKYKSGDSVFAIVRTNGSEPDATIKSALHRRSGEFSVRRK